MFQIMIFLFLKNYIDNLKEYFNLVGQTLKLNEKLMNEALKLLIPLLMINILFLVIIWLLLKCVSTYLFLLFQIFIHLLLNNQFLRNN